MKQLFKIMMKSAILPAMTLAMMLSLMPMQMKAQDAMPSEARRDKPHTAQVDTLASHIRAIHDGTDIYENIIFGDEGEAGLALNVENLLMTLQKYDVKFPEIVLSQALLETGNFTSNVCSTHKNLFGLRHPSDGSYYSFMFWEESVKAYRDDVQYKYKGGDYFEFLKKIGYAEDKKYVAKVKKIFNSLNLKKS